MAKKPKEDFSHLLVNVATGTKTAHNQRRGPRSSMAIARSSAKQLPTIPTAPETKEDRARVAFTLASEGHSRAAIARAWGLSVSTIRNYMRLARSNDLALLNVDDFVAQQQYRVHLVALGAYRDVVDAGSLEERAVARKSFLEVHDRIARLYGLNRDKVKVKVEQKVSVDPAKWVAESEKIKRQLEAEVLEAEIIDEE